MSTDFVPREVEYGSDLLPDLSDVIESLNRLHRRLDRIESMLRRRERQFIEVLPYRPASDAAAYPIEDDPN